MADIVDPAERLEALIARQAPQFAAGFRTLVAGIKEAMDLETLADLIARGQLEDALREALRRAPALGNLYTNAFVAAAQDTASFLNRNLESIVVSFDQTNPLAVRIAQENQLRLVAEFTREQTAVTRDAIADGVQRGLNPREQARNFRDSIGLTRKQQQAVRNFRRLLEDGDRAALRRELRDKRFDRTLQRAFINDEPLTPSQIDNMVDRYRTKYVRHRSEVIGRTESLKAVHEGNHNMYQQAIDAGELDPNNLMNEWNTAKDERVRGSHRALHGQKVPFGQPFTSGLGNQGLHPGGFGAPADDIQCRCAVGTRITQVSAPAGINVEILGI